MFSSRYGLLVTCFDYMHFLCIIENQFNYQDPALKTKEKIHLVTAGLRHCVVAMLI
jgi:hypothetical protein